MPIYRRFSSVQAAWEAIEKVDRAHNWGSGQTWGVPIEHPYKDEALVKYRPEMLNVDAQTAFAGTEEVDLEEAAKREYYIGPFPGRFGKSRAKLEEAQLLFDALLEERSRRHQPVVRALFFAFLSTLYALRESLKKVSMAKDEPLRSWWKKRQAELDKSGELLQYLLFVVNRDKHNASGYLQYQSRIYKPYYTGAEVPPGTASIRESSEGQFAYVYPDTPKFRRIPIGTAEGDFFVQLVGAPGLHLGKQVAGGDMFIACETALDYFEQVVFKAETLEKSRLEADKHGRELVKGAA